ncbi:MAG: hypothetical protein ACRCV6_09355 [Formosimonas sp.]
MAQGKSNQPNAVKQFIKAHSLSCEPDALTAAGALKQSALTCHVFAQDDDPSPWPVLIIGVEHQKVAAFSTVQPLRVKGWTCRNTPQGLPICTVNSISKNNQSQWLKRWTTLFHNAN